MDRIAKRLELLTCAESLLSLSGSKLSPCPARDFIEAVREYLLDEQDSERALDQWLGM